MSRIIIYPYKMSSTSSKLLTEELRNRGHEVLRVYPDRNYKYKQDDVIINWGNGREPNWIRDVPYDNMFNEPYLIRYAVNKLDFLFTVMAINEEYDYVVNAPEWTTLYTVASRWISEGHTVYARTTITGHGGEGIVVCKTMQELDAVSNAPLFTKKFNKTNEYRIHVWSGEVLDAVEKKKKKNGTGNRLEADVWSHSNGFVFCRGGVIVPEPVLEVSRHIVNAIGLDFGAVDIGWNEETQEAVVFEVNTAPGITGTTLNKYVEKIDGYIG